MPILKGQSSHIVFVSFKVRPMSVCRFAVMLHFDPNNRRRQQANATVTYLWIRANLC